MAKTPSPKPTERTYNFTAQCKSGSSKSTTFTATSYSEARKKLQEFIDAN